MDLENVKVRADAPYPEIENAMQDRETVRIIRNLSTSKTGELNAVLEYIFQSIVADRVMPDVAKLFEEIAIVEMEHLDLLQSAMQDFGGLPKYEDGQGNIYNTSNVNYSVKLKDMLEGNIASEEMAIKEYGIAIERVSNQSLKDLLERIREDEKLHLEIFKNLQNNIQFLSI